MLLQLSFSSAWSALFLTSVRCERYDNIKHQLGEEDKEKGKEVEGTVTPVEKEDRSAQ